MKTNIFAIVFACLSLLFAATSCDDKLDIVPKGESTLSNVDDLESLLNQVYTIYPNPEELNVLCGHQIAMSSLGKQLTETNTYNYALLTGDESVDREALSDNGNANDYYKNLYSRIKYFNVVIAKAPEATGSDVTRRRIVAEAKILRAWYHFLAVNIYAEQYDEATAASKGGIAYVDNINNSEEKTKLSLAQVYEKLLADCTDEVIEDLNPNTVKTAYRFGKDFGLGVRARILFQMKRYSEALKYAEKALAVNSTIEDRSSILSTGLWTSPRDAEHNYLLINSGNTNLGDLCFTTVTKDIVALFEPGDYTRYYITPGEGWEDDYCSYYDLDGCMYYYGVDLYYNMWGLRTESMYYLAAECLIRGGQIQDGLRKIDTVRKYRIDNPVMYAEKTGLTEAEAMKIYQDCRAIEFVGTFENFFDRKRWNTEEKYRKTIVHDLGSFGTFTVAPDSKLWVYPFPTKARNLNPSLTLNY